ncbi:phage head-tail joining protein [Caldimonas tepidiphila]|uniref:phage head-tail joining protein n=1 Tax=Caldimonas tepidiphila TaxID=2315841 RepID=UPI000E5AC3BA|nr:hypothetical protein [Caldimonas tepidiphila]
MALSQSDLDSLDAAIASSELEVELDGRRIRYRSITELQAARAHVANVLAAQAPGRRAGGAFRFNFTTSRGD